MTTLLDPAARMAAISAPPLPTGLDTPCVVVDLERLERNVAAMAAVLAERGIALRPHAKTHKSIRISRMQVDAGAVGLTVGTLGEAEVLAGGGMTNLFVAYPVFAARPKAARLRALLERADVSVGVDSAVGARMLGEAVTGVGRRLRVLVEVDSGGSRTGVPPERAGDVARAAERAGLDVEGVFTHGGHGYASPDAPPAAADDEVRALSTAAAALRAEGIEPRVLSAGATPTATRSARAPVTEERPGTYVFGDRQQVGLGAGDPDGVALFVLATVVSDAVPGYVVIDAGAKVLAKDRPAWADGFGSIVGLPAAVIERTYDYHAVVRVGDGERPAVGDVMAVAPNHVCPVVNLVDELLVIRAGTVVERWPVDARGRSG